MISEVVIPFHTTDWSQINTTEHVCETGITSWRTLQFGDLRVRLAEYSAGYLADRWCSKDHILYCLERKMTTELSDGSCFILTQGMSYQVSDDVSTHRSSTSAVARLFIIDGDFLKLKSKQHEEYGCN